MPYLPYRFQTSVLDGKREPPSFCRRFLSGQAGLREVVVACAGAVTSRYYLASRGSLRSAGRGTAFLGECSDERLEGESPSAVPRRSFPPCAGGTQPVGACMHLRSHPAVARACFCGGGDRVLASVRRKAFLYWLGNLFVVTSAGKSSFDGAAATMVCNCPVTLAPSESAKAWTHHHEPASDVTSVAHGQEPPRSGVEDLVWDQPRGPWFSGMPRFGSRERVFPALS